MNTAAAITETPTAAVCALPMLGFALRHLEALNAGQPLPQSPETEGLPTDVAGLIAFCIRRANDAQDVVQTAFNELDKINEPETNPVAMLLDEIL